MIAAAPVLTNLFLSLAAIAGLSVLQTVIVARGASDPLNRRFLFELRLTMLLFAGRALTILTGVVAFGVMVLLAASLIPIAVLIMTEGLLRQHAPRPIKALVGVGTVVFTTIALWPCTAIVPMRSYALLVFQLGGLLAAGFMVLTRDRPSLLVAENRAVGRLGLPTDPMPPRARRPLPELIV